MSAPVGTTLYAGSSVYAASHLLFAPAYEDEPPHGLLLACPARSGFLVYPMRDRSVVDSVEPLIALVHGLFADGPVSISTSLFWWRRGAVEEIVTTRDGERFGLTPTEGFNAAVRDLVHAN